MSLFRFQAVGIAAIVLAMECLQQERCAFNDAKLLVDELNAAQVRNSNHGSAPQPGCGFVSVWPGQFGLISVHANDPFSVSLKNVRFLINISPFN